MGDLADSIIAGEICAFCMLPFVKEKNEESAIFVPFEHGYPVACKECWEPDCGYQRATAETL